MSGRPGGAAIAAEERVAVLEARVALRRKDVGLDVDLRVGEGVTALFGPSGAGKTTLLHCIAGLVSPDSGRIALAGETLFDSGSGRSLPPERRRVGVVFQDLRLFPHRTVRENLLFGWRGDAVGGPAGGAGAARPEAVTPERVFALLELTPLLARRPATLSGGEARRVALGRALLSSPRLLLLDEPLAGLDEARKSAVLELLGQIRAEFGVPMLLVSHSLPDILQLTTQVAVLEAGRLLGQGELHDVLGSDRVFRLADSLGLESVLDVEITAVDPDEGLVRARVGTAEIALPPVARPVGTRALVAVRSEDVILAREPVAGISAQNALEGNVTRVARLSDRLLVTVEIGGGAGALRAEITPRSERQLGVEPGARVFCLVKALSFRWRRLPER